MSIQLEGSLYITGSITASAGLLGTASYANNALTASYALNASGGGLTPNFTITLTTMSLSGSTSVGGYSFDSLYNNTYGTRQAGGPGIILTDINDIQYIGAFAFQNHDVITGSINVPSCKFIGNSAFINSNVAYNSPVELIAPSCSAVGNATFQRAGRLVSASIGYNTTLLFVGANTFNDCTALKYVYIPTLSGSNALGGTTINTNVFRNVAVSGSITIPSFYSSSNAGQPDGDLATLISASWTVTYV